MKRRGRLEARILIGLGVEPLLVESTMKLNIDNEVDWRVVDKWRQGRVSPDIECTVMYVVEVLRQPTSILV